MLASLVLVPVLAPLLAAALIAFAAMAGLEAGRPLSSAGAIVSAAALAAVWLAVRASQEVNLGGLGDGVSLAFRVDGPGFAFGLIISVPAAILLTVQRRRWREAALASAGLGLAMAGVEAGGLLLTSVAAGGAATLAAVQLSAEPRGGRRVPWIQLFAAWPALALVGSLLQAQSGTDAYSAVPVASFTVPVFLILLVAAILASGLVPWRSWPAQVWSMAPRGTASFAVVTVFPLGFYLLVRAYEMGDGRYPAPALQTALGVLGALVAAGAAWRAQAAASRRAFFDETVLGSGGFALMGITLGNPLGLSAGLILLAATALLAAGVALVPDSSRHASLIGIAAAIGLPPGIVFGARVLGLESTFEGGDFLGLLGIGGVVAWAVWMLAGARAAGLGAAPESVDAGRGSPHVAGALFLLILVAGAGLAAFKTWFANPAQAAVMQSAPGLGVDSLASVVTVSTTVPALALFAPILLAGAVGYLISKPAPAHRPARAIPLPTPWVRWSASVKGTAPRGGVPEQYRSLLDPKAIEAALTQGRAGLWLAALLALAFAITR